MGHLRGVLPSKKQLRAPFDSGTAPQSFALRAPRPAFRDEFAPSASVRHLTDNVSVLLLTKITYSDGAHPLTTGRILSWCRRHSFASLLLITATVAAGALLSTGARIATGEGLDAELGPLSSVTVPAPIGGDIIDQAAAVRLGKAPFWDGQLRGDGQTPCATCHLHRGPRKRPPLHPTV